MSKNTATVGETFMNGSERIGSAEYPERLVVRTLGARAVRTVRRRYRLPDSHDSATDNLVDPLERTDAGRGEGLEPGEGLAWYMSVPGTGGQ